MKFRSQKMVEESLARIEVHQGYISQLDSMTYHIRSSRRHDRVGDDGMRMALYEMELNEWRTLFMWGLVADEETRERIKAAAYQRFLSDKKSVAWMMSADGVTPSRWLQADEEEFREMARQAFAPKKSLDDTPSIA